MDVDESGSGDAAIPAGTRLAFAIHSPTYVFARVGKASDQISQTVSSGSRRHPAPMGRAGPVWKPGLKADRKCACDLGPVGGIPAICTVRLAVSRLEVTNSTVRFATTGSNWTFSTTRIQPFRQLDAFRRRRIALIGVGASHCVTESGRPGWLPTQAPHRSGRADFPHPAPRNTVSLHAGVAVDNPRTWQGIAT